MKFFRIGLLGAAFLILAVLGSNSSKSFYVFAQTPTQSITLGLSDLLSVTCASGLIRTRTVSSSILEIFCEGVSVPTSTSTPTPTTMQHPTTGTGVCGEPMDRWHPAVYNGCQTGHEHGDPPPSWIRAAGYDPTFHGTHGTLNTSPIENTTKHTSMKAFLAKLDGSDVYFRAHFSSNPMERFGTYHSYEVFARDAGGKVSHWQGWTFSGKPTSTTDRCVRRSPASSCESARPIILVTDQTSINQGISCEQWYAATASWSWDFGWTICGSTTVYQRDKEQTSVSVFDQSTWKLTGSLGLTRRLEAAWYGPDSIYIKNRGNPPKDRKFWATQFGELVSGPTDPKCSASTLGRDSNTYKNVCLEQYIASSMKSVEFPGNAMQKTFDGTGVKIPN